jgi:hypothetical protein
MVRPESGRWDRAMHPGRGGGWLARERVLLRIGMCAINPRHGSCEEARQILVEARGPRGAVRASGGIARTALPWGRLSVTVTDARRGESVVELANKRRDRIAFAWQSLEPHPVTANAIGRSSRL